MRPSGGVCPCPHCALSRVFTKARALHHVYSKTDTCVHSVSSTHTSSYHLHVPLVSRACAAVWALWGWNSVGERGGAPGGRDERPQARGRGEMKGRSKLGFHSERAYGLSSACSVVCALPFLCLGLCLCLCMQLSRSCARDQRLFYETVCACPRLLCR